MTAINAYGRGGVGLLLTDAAMYTAEGVYLRSAEKTAILPTRKRMAVAARGYEGVAEVFAEAIDDEFRGLDALVADNGRALQEMYNSLWPDPDPSGVDDIDLVIVGWSEERDGAEAYVLSSVDHRERGGNIAPFEMVRHDYVMAPTPVSYLRSRGFVSPAGALNGRPLDVLMASIDGQRIEQCEVSWTDERLYLVGGHATLTRITRTAVRQETVRRWDDVPGQRINPHANAIANNNPPMTRQQRRAAERQAAKRSA